MNASMDQILYTKISVVSGAVPLFKECYVLIKSNLL